MRFLHFLFLVTVTGWMAFLVAGFPSLLSISSPVIAYLLSISCLYKQESGSSTSPADQHREVVLIPANSTIQNKTLDQWAGEWYAYLFLYCPMTLIILYLVRWAWQYNTDGAAVLDTTGANCSVNQTFGVWFLAGCFNCSQGINRTCLDIPPDTQVFVPVITTSYLEHANFTNVTLTDLLSQVSSVFNQTTDLFLEIDNHNITLDPQFRQISKEPLFFTFETDLFAAAGFPRGSRVKLVAAGWHVMIAPMKKGEVHQLHFGGVLHQADNSTIVVDVTYHIGVNGCSPDDGGTGGTSSNC